MNDFEIGIITKAQGIRGEVRVLPTTDDSSRFELLVGGEVSVRREGGAGSYELTAARLQKNIVVLKFSGIDDRNSAEALIGARIYVPREKALALSEGEYFVRDLIGLSAVDEQGGEIGVLRDVMHTAANDIYIVETPPGDGGGSFMLPAIRDVVREVDIAAGKIILRLPDGVRELKI